MQLLRASSEHSGQAIDFNAILGETGGDVGIPHADLLVALAEAVHGDDEAALTAARANLVEAMGEAALVDSAAVVATFNAIDRIADATGIPLEDDKAESTAELRADLGIDAFAPTG